MNRRQFFRLFTARRDRVAHMVFAESAVTDVLDGTSHSGCDFLPAGATEVWDRPPGCE